MVRIENNKYSIEEASRIGNAASIEKRRGIF